MSQFYTDPTRETDPYALPDAEVFYLGINNDPYPEDGEKPLPIGWYWWPCFPGCMPDGDPVGPFDSEAEAIADARAES